MSEPVPFFVGTADEKGKITWDFPSQVTAYIRKKFAGKAVEVEIREMRDKRSDRQNRGFHALIAPWAREEGHDVDELKLDLLREIFGTHEVTSLVTGEVTQALNEPHTSKLNVTQFSELIERTLDIAAGCGVVLVAPDEYRKAKEKAEKQKRPSAA